MQNELKRSLPASFIALLPPHQDLAYAAIPVLQTLSPAERKQIIQVYAAALRVIWRIMVVVAVAGLVSCIGMREIRMTDEMDARFALETRETGVESSDGAIEMGVTIKAKMREGVEIEDDRPSRLKSPLF